MPFDCSIKVFLLSAMFGVLTPLYALASRSGTHLNPSEMQVSEPEVAQSSDRQFELEDFEFWVDQCLTLSQASDPEKTLETCEQAILLRPDEPNIDLWNARSQALFQLGQYPEAIASFNRVVSVAPEDSISRAYQCAALVQLDRYDDAIDTCELALQINGNWGDRSPGFAWYQRGIALQQLGRLTTAYSSFQRATENQPESVIYQASECALSIELGEFETCSPRQATAIYEQAIALQPENADLWLQQGLALEQLGDYERALVAYEQAIALTPTHAFALAHQCAVLNQLQQHEAALTACEAAFQGDNRWGRVGIAYGWVQHSSALIGLEDYEAALASAERATDSNAVYPPGWSNQAVSLWYLGQLAVRDDATQQANLFFEQARTTLERASAAYDDARNQLDAFEREYPEPPLFYHRGRILNHYNHGRILSSLGEFQEAIGAYALAIYVYGKTQEDFSIPNPIDHSTYASVLTNQAIAYLRNNQSSEAFRRATEATEQDPTSFAAWYNKGIIALEANQHFAALDAFAQANRISPENIYVITGQGLALVGIDCRQTALAVFEHALNIAPGYPLAEYERNQLMMTPQPESEADAEPPSADSCAALLQ